ncbi:tape measure protein [Acinetobacter towneri]|uniref:tape measure protein n=1 Tax=Acinetobacter towneri TaxID=202956 RepID=UPI0034D50252
MSKNLTFKLIMDADSKGFVSGVKQSESVAKSVFDAIKTESDKLKQSSAEAAKELGNIIPKGTSEQATALTKTLTSATEIIKNAGDNAKSTAGNFTDFGNKSHKALDLLKADLTSAKQKLQEFSNSNASPADIEVAQRQVDQLEKEVQQADQAFNDFQAEVGRANTQLKETDSAATSAKKGLDGAKFAVNALVGAMAALGVGLGLRELAEAADSYTNLSARIKIATAEHGNFEQAMAGVHQVALATNSNLEATAGLFTKVNDVGKQMGMTQQQSLDLVKTINMAIQTGGGSAQASEAAITQFTQALQSGVLRGDEFNSIMEQAPGISKALAASLGVTTGELRKMAENGELSAEKVIKALQGQSAAIQAEYDQFPTTIGNALQRIQTQWQILIGTMDQANGASATVAEWLVMLADNMGIVETILEDIGEGFVWVGDQLKKIDPETIIALKNAAQQAYETVKSMIESVGESVTVGISLLDTALNTILNYNNGINAAEANTNGFTKALEVAGVVFALFNDGFKGIAITVNLFAGAMYEATGAFMYWKSKFMLGDAKEAAFKEFQDLTARAKQLYAQADQLAMGHSRTVIDALNEVGRVREQKTEDAKALSKEELDTLLSNKDQETAGVATSEQEKLKAVQDYAEAAIKANGGVMDGVMQADLMTKGYIVTIDEAGKVSVQAGENAAQAAEKAKEKEEALKLAKENVKKADEELLAYQKQAAIERVLLDKQIEEAKRTGDLNALASAKSSINAINAKEAELANNRDLRVAELNKANTGSGQIAETAYSRASAAAKLFGVDLDVSLNKVSKSFNSSGNDLNDLKNRLEEAGVTGKQAGDVTYQAWLKWLETAKSQAEIDMAKAKLEQFGEQGKLSTSQVEQGLIAVKHQAQGLPDDIDPVTAAFKRLGIETKENLKLSAQQALMDYITIRDSGKATAEGIQKAYEKAAQAAALSGDQAVIASANAAGAGRDLRVEIDETGKASVKAMDDLTEANHRVRESARRIGDGYREAGQIAREEANAAQIAWNKASQEAAQKWDAEMKRQSKGLSAAISGYQSMSKNDVISQIKSMGYSEDQAKKLAGSIWSQGLNADSDAKFAAYGKGGNLAMFKLIEQEFNNAAAKGLTTQHGTNKINELLRNLDVRSTGSTPKVNDYVPNISEPKIRDLQNDVPTKNVRFEFVSGGKRFEMQGSQEDGDMMESILREFEMLKKAM